MCTFNMMYVQWTIYCMPSCVAHGAQEMLSYENIHFVRCRSIRSSRNSYIWCATEKTAVWVAEELRVNWSDSFCRSFWAQIPGARKHAVCEKVRCSMWYHHKTVLLLYTHVTGRWTARLLVARCNISRVTTTSSETMWRLVHFMFLTDILLYLQNGKIMFKTTWLKGDIQRYTTKFMKSSF